MKILHTSDWHLGKRLDNFSRYDEQRAVMEEINAIADNESVDAIIISGDLFDTYNPPTEAVDLFYKTLKKLSKNGDRPVIAIAGNHDSPDRIENPEPLARECGIIFIGYPNTVVPPLKLETGMEVLKSDEGFVELKIPNCTLPLRIIHTSYANEFRLKTYLGKGEEEQNLRELLQLRWEQLADQHCDEHGVNILAAHLFFMKKNGTMPGEPDSEKSILHVGGAQAIFTNNLPRQVQYVALGHLHRKQTIDSNPCPVVYAGSPLSYSFSEANQEKFVMIAEFNMEKKISVEEIKLTAGKKLVRIRATSIEDALGKLKNTPNALVELTLVSDHYLTAQDRKLLHKAHDGIVNIIPEIKNKEILHKQNMNIDLTKSMEDLFKDYFIHEKGQQPNERIMNLFKEVLAGGDDE